MFLFSLALDLVSAGLILIPAYLVLNRVYFRSLNKAAACCIFSFYLVAVYHLVGMPCVTYINPGVNLNLIPFADMLASPQNTLLNVALFLPLGFLLPLIWEQFRNIKHTVLFGFGMSLTIELLQMLTLRATDINDLITNTLGAYLGFLMVKPVMGRFPAAASKPSEVYAVCAGVFAIMFFIDPFIFTFFWNLILH